MNAAGREPTFFTRENLLPGVSRWYIPPFAANQKANLKNGINKSDFFILFAHFRFFILHFACFSRILRRERGSHLARAQFELSLKSTYNTATRSTSEWSYAGHGHPFPINAAYTTITVYSLCIYCFLCKNRCAESRPTYVPGILVRIREVIFSADCMKTRYLRTTAVSRVQE